MPKDATTHLAGSREFANDHLRDLQEGSDKWHRSGKAALPQF